ncbi:MAG: PTS sugar transporter subunit IIA [Planctomycetota bacterium]|nr:PTS sugar transporter subunit IIA [Planctomycetota bacterium]
MEKLLESCDQGLVNLGLRAKNLEDALDQMVDDLGRQGVIEKDHIAEIKKELARSEKRSTTSIGHSVAVPHAYLKCITNPIISIARLHHGVNEGAPDGVPVQFVFLLLGPPGALVEHLDSLADVARLMSDDEFHYLALTAQDPKSLREAIVLRMSGESAVEHHESVGEGLRSTNKFLGGVIQDIQRRGAHYWSDFLDGFHQKSLSSTFFLFFACLAPAIIFGGLMHAKTGGQIGAIEMILATAGCGLLYAIFAGQPMIILGGTGPMLIFTGMLYDYCDANNLEFLPVYAWVGFWTGLILLILAATDASCLMRFFTRFTDEIFAALISVIFIYESIAQLVEIFHVASQGEPVGYDVALLSLILALGTFYIASSLSAFRKSHLLVPSVREFLADFGPTIAIVGMAIIAYFSRDAIQTQSLEIPDGFQPTLEERNWLVSFMEIPLWAIWGSIIPAILCSVLVFLDQNITARLVNSRDNNLQKGESYHLDLGVVGILIAVCSAFGLPWLVAATVRSLNHLRSLATTEEVFDSTGRGHTHILHVRENRVTGILIHLLVGLSLFFLSYLEFVPLAVLFGLFLYMGVVSMKGNQFFERLSLWATDPALYPSQHYVRRVPWKQLHLFTLVQLLCLVVLWVVKTSTWGILFPLFIALLVPIRILLGLVFDSQHIAVLDAEEIPEEEEETWT